MKTFDWIKNLSPEQLIIVPNQRTARWLRSDYDEAQRRAGLSYWQDLNVFSLKDWLLACCDQVLPSVMRCLSEDQEIALWDQIIVQTLDDGWPLNARMMAHLMADAWRLLHEANLSLSTLGHEFHDDVQAFYQCARVFEKTCAQNNWVSTATQPQILASHLGKLNAMAWQSVFPYKALIFKGFDHWSENLQVLITTIHNHLHTATSDTVQQATQTLAPQQHRRVCDTTEDEIKQMLHWAKSAYLINPNQRIICQVPTLNEHRDYLQQIAREVFEQATTIPYNLASGIPCADYQMIADALALLAFINAKQGHAHTVSQLITSPFLGGSRDERNERALLDASMRAQGQAKLSLKILLKQAHLKQCPELAKQCQAALNLESPERGVNQALTHMRRILACFDWPGQRSLNSEAYQLHKRWHRLIEQCENLAIIKPQAGFSECLSHLKWLCQVTRFQAETQDANIHILGTLEAAALPCDLRWVMGMDDQQMPAKARPNPMLPIRLQQLHDMPHASAQKEWQFATMLSNRIATNSRELIYSHATMDANGNPRAVSALFADIPICQASKPTASQTHAARALEYLHDDLAAPVQAADALQHGSRIFSDQAQCPFKAFATHRLHAACLPNPSAHIDQADKGALLHMALDAFWQATRDHATLCKLTPQALQRLIRQTTDVAWKKLISQTSKSVQPTLRTAISKAIQDLLLQWLALEKQRPPFKTTDLESALSTTLYGIPITVRPDRIDQLPSGAYLLIDYKTGQASASHWFKTPLSAPQMPLYVMALPLPIHAIAYAHVKYYACQWDGVTASTEDLPALKPITRVAPDLPALKSQWGKALEGIAAAFLAGQADVAPSTPASCQYCDLDPLCRIQEKITAMR